MRTALVLPASLAFVMGTAVAQAHQHNSGAADGHDHAAASGSGQAIFDAAITRAPPAVQPAPGRTDTSAQEPDPHASHGEGGHSHRAENPQPSTGDAHHGHPSAVPSTHGPGTHADHADAGTQSGEPVPAPSDADRAAAFPVLHGDHHGHGNTFNSLVRFNRFETWDADPGTGQAWEGSAWIGGDVQRLWLRSEGEREHGHTVAADLEVLYGRGISPWWDLVAGVRHDFAPGPSQSWAAVGVQGLAPYKFEVSATAYLGEHGQSALVAEAEYELLLSNRLILQPLLEVELRGRDDPRRGIGSGLSTAEAGLRLRYEVTRRFAPYLGMVHERAYGGTADHRRQADEPVRDTRWVAGVRWWF
jgi:copper resistance protein B